MKASTANFAGLELQTLWPTSRTLSLTVALLCVTVCGRAASGPGTVNLVLNCSQ